MEKDTCCNTGKQKPKCKNTHKQKPKTGKKMHRKRIPSQGGREKKKKTIQKLQQHTNSDSKTLNCANGKKNSGILY